MNDSEELAREAADLFVWLGEQAIVPVGTFRVALSGGSTPRAVYSALSGEACSKRLDWSRVEFYFGDERCVPPDHPDSNFGMANAALFRPLKIDPRRICRMPGEEDDPDRAARRYEALLRDRFGVPAPGWPSFDLILLGLGEDGHTASVFPGTNAVVERTRLVVPGTAPIGVTNRLTLTVPAINAARTVLFLVSGGAKATVVRAVLEGRDPREQSLPARLIRPANGRLIWFLDRAAAADLTVEKQIVDDREE